MQGISSWLVGTQYNSLLFRECRQFKNIGLQASVSVIPALAGMTVNMTTLPKPKPRWDVHLSGDDDQPGFAG